MRYFFIFCIIIVNVASHQIDRHHRSPMSMKYSAKNAKQILFDEIFDYYASQGLADLFGMKKRNYYSRSGVISKILEDLHNVE